MSGACGKGTRSARTGTRHGCDPHVCAGKEPGSSAITQVPLITEPSLQLLKSFLK